MLAAAAAAAVAAGRKHSHSRELVSSSAGHSSLEPDLATHEFGTDLGLAKLREGAQLNQGTRGDWFDRSCLWEQLACYCHGGRRLLDSKWDLLAVLDGVPEIVEVVVGSGVGRCGS